VGFFLDPGAVWQFRSQLLNGLGMTLRLAAVVFTLSVPLAIAVALLRRHGPRAVAAGLASLTLLVRGVPAVVTVVFVFFALPFAGVTLEAFTAAVVTLTLVQTVNFAEIFRAALTGVPGGPVEAAHASGLSAVAVFRHVVLPQGLVLALPPFISSCIQLLHNTTLAAVVTLGDLISEALAVQTATGSPSALIAAATLYLALLLPLVHLARVVERRVAPRRR
jgi:polar amino acid transport system permease protein